MYILIFASATVSLIFALIFPKSRSSAVFAPIILGIAGFFAYVLLAFDGCFNASGFHPEKCGFTGPMVVSMMHSIPTVILALVGHVVLATIGIMLIRFARNVTYKIEPMQPRSRS